MTAADHLRRRHPDVRDRPGRRGAAPPLQPDGHLAARLRPLGDAGALPQPRRLVRRARDHDLAEHARARRSTAPTARSRSARASKLAYDRLILATGSSSFVPADRGLRRAPGPACCASADDAMGLRAFAQRPATRRAAIAGGGLLGLEAAYALHKLGLQDRRARALRPAAAPPARRPRRPSMLRALPRRPRARDRDRAPRSRPSRPTAACAPCTLPTAAGSRRRSCSSRPASSRTSTWPATRAGDQPRRASSTTACAPSDPAILAAGDIAEFGGQVPGLWPTAVAQAEVAAENAVGGDKAYAGGPGDDPQGRRHRADVDRAVRGAPARERRSCSRTRPAATTASS